MVYVIGWCRKLTLRGKRRRLGAGHWRLISGPHRSTPLAIERGQSLMGTDRLLMSGEVFFIEEFRVMGASLLPLYGCALPNQEHNLPLPGMEAMK